MSGNRESGRTAAPEPAHVQLNRAVEVMREVRERCVWTQGITHEALVPYLIEESHELIDAVESGSRVDMREELGDLLWQVLFHAEIASRDADAPFDIDDVAGDLADKMVRRHPHVFAGETAATPEEVLVHWNAAKAAEKRERTSVLDGLSRGMPALALADKLLGKAAKVGLAGGADAGGAGRADASAGDAAELGDRLLALVAEARAAGVDAEGALRARLRELEGEIRAAERPAEQA